MINKKFTNILTGEILHFRIEGLYKKKQIFGIFFSKAFLFIGTKLRIEKITYTQEKSVHLIKTFACFQRRIWVRKQIFC